MRGSEVQVLASLCSGLLLFNVVIAHPLLVKRSLHPRVSYQSSHQSYHQSQSYGDETFGSHPRESSVREKRVIKEVVVGVGSGLKGTSVAGLKALASASAGTLGAIGSASAGTVGALGSASAGTVVGAGKASAGVLGAVGSAGLGALGAASGLGVRAVGAASGVGLKAVGSASGLGLNGAKALGAVGLSSSKVVGTTGVKVAAKTGFAVAKAAVTVGIAKFILSLIFGKINQLIDLRGKLFGVSNPKSNNILSVSLPSSAFAPAHQQQDTTNDDKIPEPVNNYSTANKRRRQAIASVAKKIVST